MKKLVSILLTLAVAVSLLVIPAVAAAGPVGAPFFTTNGEGTAEWSDEQSVSGPNSAKLWIPAFTTLTPYDEARVVFNYEGDLNSIEEVSYQSYVIGGNDGTLYPSVVLAVDINDDDAVDSWVVQFTPLDSHTPSEGAWETISFDGDSPVHVAGATTGLPADHYKPYTTEFTLTDTLTSLKAVNGWGDFAVLEVKVIIGEFTNLTETMTAYVDDITINEATYSFDPTSGVNVVVNTPEITAISVTPTSINFGTLYPGESSDPTTLTISNIGTVKVKVTTSIDESGTFFADNLQVGGKKAVNYSKSLAVGGSPATPDAQVVVPSTYPAVGAATGMLVFTATAV